jgi:hypothetical protein
MYQASGKDQDEIFIKLTPKMKTKLKTLTIVELAMRKSKSELSYFEIGLALGLGVHPHKDLSEDIVEEIEETILTAVN